MGRRATLALAVSLVIAALAFGRGLGNGFPYDDAFIAQSQVEGRSNPMVDELQPLSAYFTTEYWRGAGSNRADSNPLFRPVTIYSIALTHQLWPGHGTPASEAFPHRLLNLLLHLANALLVFLLVRYLSRRLAGDSPWPATWAAAVFALAAIHTEPVVAIVGRADLLALGFGLGGILLGLRSRDSRGGSRIAFGSGAGLAFFLACSSKESGAAMWPLFACVAIVTKPANWKSGALLALAIGVPALVAFAALRIHAFAHLPEAQVVAYVSNPLAHVPATTRILAGIAIQGYAVWSTLWPWPLACDYGATVFPFAAQDPQWGLSAIAYFTLGFGVVATCGFAIVRRKPWLFLVTATFAGPAAITSNVLLPIGTTHAERLTYLPSLALALGVAALVPRLRGPWCLPVVVVWCLVNAAIVAHRAPQWQDNATLFRADVAQHPESLFLRLSTAIVEQRAGNWQAWREHLEAGVRSEPEWARGHIELAAGRIVLARMRAQQTKSDAHLAAELAAAEASLRKAAKARILEPIEHRMLGLNLGSVLVQQGRADEADREYRRLLQLHPLDVDARHAILINAAIGMSDTQFLALLQDSEHHVPDHSLWIMHRGLRAARRNELDAARRLLTRALPSIQKNDSSVLRARTILQRLLK